MLRQGALESTIYVDLKFKTNEHFLFELPNAVTEVQGHFARVSNLSASLGHTVLDHTGLSNPWPRAWGRAHALE